MTGKGTRPSTSYGVAPAHLASASSAGWANRLRLCTQSTAWCRCTDLVALALVPGRARCGPARWSGPSRARRRRLGLTEGPRASSTPRQDVGHLARAHVGQDGGVGARQDLHGAHAHHRERPALGQHAPQPVQERPLVAQLGLHVERAEAVDRVHERRQVELGEVGLARSRRCGRATTAWACAPSPGHRDRCCHPSAARRRSR